MVAQAVEINKIKARVSCTSAVSLTNREKHQYSLHKQQQMKTSLKTGIAILAVTLGLSTSVNAQSFEYGIKAGGLYNSTSFGNKNVKDKSGKIGAQIGVFARTAERLYFQPELAFSMSSVKYTFENVSYKPKFYQVNLPLQVGYKFYEQEGVNLRVSAGPQLNYDLKKNAATSTTSFKKLSYDALINLGVDVDKFTLDVRYNHGLNKINKALDARNQTWGVSVGYKF